MNQLLLATIPKASSCSLFLSFRFFNVTAILAETWPKYPFGLPLIKHKWSRFLQNTRDTNCLEVNAALDDITEV